MIYKSSICPLRVPEVRLQAGDFGAALEVANWSGGGWSEKLGPDFLIALIFFEDLPWTNFSELYTRGGNPHRPVILGSKDGTTILLQKRALLLLFLGGQRIYPQVTNFGLACWFNNLEINWLC